MAMSTSKDEFILIHESVAGIDVGSEKIFIATEDSLVVNFNTFTIDYQAAIKHLKDKKVMNVVMEATGVYWVTLYEMLEDAGFTIYVINGYQAKHVPGRKSDVLDCEWLRKLHTFGLLRASFIPPLEIRELRSYLRLREQHVQSGTQHIQHMQKALTLMNIRLHNVLSNTVGASSLRVIEAVLSGKHDPNELVELCDKSILKHKRQEVIESLRGNYRSEHLFALQQALTGWKFYQQQIKECDQRIEQVLHRMAEQQPTHTSKKSKKVRFNGQNQPQIKGLNSLLQRIMGGKNPMEIVGLSDLTVLKLMGEVGTDMSAWETSKHFTSWLGLAPTKHQSGKMNRRRKWNVKPKAGQIFRCAVLGVSKSKNSAMAHFYYRLKAKHGAKVAAKATARKLAALYYDLMTKGIEYVEVGLLQYQEKIKDSQMRFINRKATEFGFVLVPKSA